MDYEEIVLNIIRKRFIAPKEFLRNSTDLYEDLGINNTDFVDVVIELEDALDIFIEDSFFKNPVSVKAIVEYIKKVKK
jgi:acyl carrier protein